MLSLLAETKKLLPAMNNLTTFALNKSMLPAMAQNDDQPQPCLYTIDEVLRRVEQSTSDAESGRDCLTNAEFQSLVRSWYR